MRKKTYNMQKSPKIKILGLFTVIMLRLSNQTVSLNLASLSALAATNGDFLLLSNARLNQLSQTISDLSHSCILISDISRDSSNRLELVSGHNSHHSVSKSIALSSLSSSAKAPVWRETFIKAALRGLWRTTS